MTEDIFWCTNCLNASTRPRISFDKKGKCNACAWSEEKKIIDWGKREKELVDLINKFKSQSQGYDCIVPVSGGKDGSYVSYQLKSKYNLNPLAITIKPALEIEIGEENLKSFIKSGFDHLHIAPNAKVMKYLNKLGYIEKGFPYYGWLIAIHTAILQIASNFNINLIFYGEDGEVEYGGLTETKYKMTYDTDYQRKIYLDDGYYNLLKKIKASDSELYFYRFPSDIECAKIQIAHWSYFEPWDPYRNYLVAKENCGLKDKKETNQGTFTNFAQNDQAFYDLHTYLMYLKFGFGRATQDAGIEIRRGAMTRDQAINLVNLFDGQYPEKSISIYLKYYEMKIDEFESILDKWANKKIFYKDNNNRWSPKFKIK